MTQRDSQTPVVTKPGQHGWQRLMWRVWDALPASKDQRGTATAPAVPISVPDGPPHDNRLIILRIMHK